MNDELHQRVEKELVRADKALRSATMLLAEGLLEDAISRAYYAVLHAAKAALAVANVSADSHAGVRRMFCLHLVKDGLIEDEYAGILVSAQEDRELGDYDIDVIIDESRARQRIQDAVRFVNRIKRHIESNGGK
jgi:hypothetical protein